MAADLDVIGGVGRVAEFNRRWPTTPVREVVVAGTQSKGVYRVAGVYGQDRIEAAAICVEDDSVGRGGAGPVIPDRCARSWMAGRANRLQRFAAFIRGARVVAGADLPGDRGRQDGNSVREVIVGRDCRRGGRRNQAK